MKVRAEGTGARAFTLLTEGEAVRMSAQHELQRWRNVTVHERAPASDAASAIASVSDNLTEPDFRRFYAIVPGGLREGAAAFTDKPAVAWRAVPGELFPAAIEGADLVRTFHADRHERDLALTLNVVGGAELFVILDTRKPAPTWLQARFVDTGARVQIGPWQSPRILGKLASDRHVTCAVWRATVEAGEVVLGPPHERDHVGPNVMYAIAARPR